MGIANGKRASSTPSAATNMSYTPDSTTSAARQRFENKMSTEARQKLKDEIEHAIKNDYIAIRTARNAAKTVRGYDDLDDRQRERKQKEAALDAIQRRKDRGLHVSSFYPVFVDYVPPAADGKMRAKDEEKDYLMYEQIHQLQSQGVRRVRDEESDDEEPNPFLLKKEERGDTPANEDSALRGTSPDTRSTKRKTPAPKSSGGIGKSEQVSSAATKQRSKKARTQQLRSDSSRTKHEHDSDSEDLSDPESQSEEEQDSYPDDDDDESEKEPPNTPLVAVLRGAPIPKNLAPYVPSKETLRLQRLAAIRRRQQLAKKENNGLVAVLRGQIEKKPDEDVDTNVKQVWVMGKGFVSRKRVREAEGGEGRGQEQKRSKRAEV
jgi:hypothetical protein